LPILVLFVVTVIYTR